MQKFNVPLLFIVILGLLFATKLVGTPKLNLIPKVNQELTWEECVKDPKAIIMEIYPAKCSLPDGRYVTQPRSDKDQKSLLPMETPNNEYLTPELAKKILPVDDIANWKTYSLGTILSFQYPPSYYTESSKAQDAVLIMDPSTRTSVATFDAASAEKVGNYEEVIKESRDTLNNFSMKDIPGGVKITGIFKSGYYEGTPSEIAYYKYKKGTIYFSNHKIDSKIFDQILSTVKFL